MVDSAGEPAGPELAWRRCMQAAAEAERQMRFAEVAEQYQDAVRIAEQFGEDDPRLADSLAALGTLASRHGPHSDAEVSAEALLRRALAIRERRLGPDHPEVARLLVPLAWAMGRRGARGDPADAVQAAALLERALAIEAGAAEIDRNLLAETANAVTNLSHSLSRHGLVAAAEALHHHLIALHEQRHGPSCAGGGMAHSNLAVLYETQERLPEAEAQLRQALRILRNQDSASGLSGAAFSLQRLALLCQKQGRWQEAATFLREALTALEADPGAEAPGRDWFIRSALAEVCLGLGEYDEVERLLQRLRAVEEGSPGLAHASAVRKIEADLLKATGRYQQAWELEHAAPRRPPQPHDRAEDLRQRVPVPRPDPDQQPGFVWITALTVGYITENSAQARWWTSREASCSFWQRQAHGGGSHYSGGSVHGGQPARDHVAGLGFGWPLPAEVEVFVSSPEGVDRTAVTVIPPRAPTADGKPRLRVEGRIEDLGRPDLAGIELRLVNEGDGEALRTRIEQIAPAAGWQLLADSLGAPLPVPLNLGTLGPGSAGVLIVRLRRRSGTAEPTVTVSGGFREAGGTVLAF